MKNRSFILIFLTVSALALFACGRKSGPQALPPALPSAAGQAAYAQTRSDISDAVSQSRRNAITRAVADVSPAVVGINVTQIQRIVSSPFDDPFFRMFFEPREMTERVQGLGSGFLISQDGYILTNEHVVHDASEIIVTTTDGKQFAARRVGSDFLFDVALLKIEGTRFPFIPLGDSRDILIGEWVIALGNPFGLFNVNSKPTVTVGVVSAIGMSFKGELRVAGRSYGDMIQTDAAINGGNSGGPLVNSLGECIGINAFIISGSNYEKTSIGIGFAIPIHRVKAILPALKTVGRVERESWTGIRIRALSAAEAGRLGISVRDGVLVESIRP
ncbi:trypsin-like peptidase domain-containing protein, partial [bacterium]|nr:trypsin-like peptidase domain-containing protein [bacterium]